MGQMRFQMPDALPAGAAAALERLRFVAGYDRTPFPTILKTRGPELSLIHDLSESGYISVPWPVPGFGFPITVSATLRERDEPYHFLTELARGKLNQVRNTVEDWKQAGLEIPKEISDTLHDAMGHFVHAVAEGGGPVSDASSGHALTLAYQMGASLAQYFLDASAKIQQARIGRTAARCTCRMDAPLTGDDAELYLNAFDVVHFAPRWQRIEPDPAQYNWSEFDAVIEWATQHGKPVIVGPLIDLNAESHPAWLDMSADAATLAAYFCDYIETVVQRYKDRVRDWHIAAGFNDSPHPHLDQEDRLRMVVRLLEAARAVDSECRLVVGVSQPWGEYLDHGDATLSPLVFCDTLLRSGLSIAGFNLEVIAGEHPLASYLRDGLELLRFFELFGLLGTPLDISLSHPGLALPPTMSAEEFSTCYHASASVDSQAEWGGFLATLSGSLSHVRCVSWNHWHDDTQGRGLIASDGQPKPLLFRLRHLKADFA